MQYIQIQQVKYIIFVTNTLHIKFTPFRPTNNSDNPTVLKEHTTYILTLNYE